MKNVLYQTRKFFPGKAFYLLIVNVFALFFVSLFDLVGVAAILPVIQIATGADYKNGYLGILYHFFNEPSQNGMALTTSAVLVFAFILKAVLSLFVKWWSAKFLAYQQTASAVSILEFYMNDSYLNHRQRTTADILRSVNEANNQVYNAYIGGALSCLGELATILMIMSALLAIMPLQALIAFVYFGISAFLLQHFFKSKNEKAGRESLEMGWKMAEATFNAVNGFRENRISGMTARRIYQYQEAGLRGIDAGRRRGIYQEMPKYLLEIIFVVGIALMLAIMLMTGGLQSAAYLLVFAGACVRILPSFIRLVASLGSMRSGAPSIELLEKELSHVSKKDMKLLDSEPEVGNFSKVNARTLPINIGVNDLYFRYPDGDQEVLSNINFSVPAGSSIAIIGGSGSGKTTLIDLILGLFEPTSGVITFNGKTVYQNITEWHDIVGYVPQDVFLSGKTIREEIAFGLKPEEIDENRIQECIALSELGDLIVSLEDGLDTVIGERGTRLSGGQRQRLGIARAIYRNPSVLVLDEATSALDNLTEHKITNAINKLAKEITVIIVAHRLSTVREVDQLIFMSGGHIVSKGTFEEVKNSNAEFARLVELGQLPE